MAEAATLLRGSGTLTPAAARRTLLARVAVPAGSARLACRLTFAPARVNGIRNLVTLSLFEPDGSPRGAAHRHEPAQVVEVGEDGATPGFVAGPLPPGEWTVAIDVHCVMPSDVGGVRYTLDVAASPRGDAAAAVTHVQDSSPTETGSIDGPRWLKGDLHVHSDHSDGRWGIAAIVDHARAAALDFVALTDHNTHTGTAPLQAALRAQGLPTIVIPGLELTTYSGHANVLGLEGWTDWRTRPPGATANGGHDVLDGTSPEPVSGAGIVANGEGDLAIDLVAYHPAATMESVARGVQGRGGLFVVNHPRSPGYPACTGCRWDFDDAPAYADAIEVMNGPWPRRQNDEAVALWDRWLAAGWRVPATAGTDAHEAPLHADRVGYTWAWSIPGVASILQAVGSGRTFLSRGPHLSWEAPSAGAPVPRGLPELAVRLGAVPPGCQVHLWCDGRLVEFRPVPEGDGIQAFPLRARPAAGTWFRVHLVHQANGATELLAITNPVWVGR